jgi:hypothetical protein
MTKTSLNTLKYLRQTGVEEVANLMEDYHISKQLALEIINIYFEFFDKASFSDYILNNVVIWDIHEFKATFKDIITEKGLVDSVEDFTSLNILYDDGMFVTTNYSDYISTEDYLQQMTSEFDNMDLEDLLHYYSCIDDLLVKSKLDNIVVVDFEDKDVAVNGKTVLKFVSDNYFTYQHLKDIWEE